MTRMRTYTIKLSEEMIGEIDKLVADGVYFSRADAFRRLIEKALIKDEITDKFDVINNKLDEFQPLLGKIKDLLHNK